MELSPGQRKAAFAVIVLALTGLGLFLVVTRAGGGQAGRPAAAAASSPAAPASPAAAATPAAVTTPAAPAGGTASVDIYRLLPFTQAALDRAVGVAQRFGAAYGTYSYRQSAGSYAATLNGLAAPGLAASVARAYATPGVAQLRIQQKQVSAGRASVTELRAFGPSSLTFVVTVVQDITQNSGRLSRTTRYAVTVTGPGHWQVNDIQPASAGNS